MFIQGRLEKTVEVGSIQLFLIMRVVLFILRIKDYFSKGSFKVNLRY